MIKIYSIAKWVQEYEVNSKGQPAKNGEQLRAAKLEYVRCKVYGKKLGPGYRRLLEVAGKTKAMLVFGIFHKFLEIAADATTDIGRGILRNERDEPASEEDLAFLLDLPLKQIRLACDVLVRIGWLEVQIEGVPENSRISRNFQEFQEFQEPSERNVNEVNTTQLNEKAPGNSGGVRKQVRSDPSDSDHVSISVTASTSLRIQSLTFYETLISIIEPRTQSDRTCFRRISQWLKQGCLTKRFDEQVFSQVLQYAGQATKARNPPAAFVSALKRNLDYQPGKIIANLESAPPFEIEND